MSRCLYVSFYTPDYAGVAHRLKVSLQMFGLDHHVIEIPDRGRWVDNCAFKPEFILREMWEDPRPVVWIDADAVVRSVPWAFEHEPRGPVEPDARICTYIWKRVRRPEVLSGTLYFSGGLGSKRLLELWIELQQKNPDMWDQRTLALAMDVARDMNITIENLPFEYVYIHDFHKTEWPEATPVIEHFQHSRETRHKKVNA